MVALFNANTAEEINALPKTRELAQSRVSGRYENFNNNILHSHFANNYYYLTEPILSHFKEHKSELLNAQDSYGCTPLLLAMKVGAPSKQLLQLMTPENVMMADKDGRTPLMLAVRGVHPVVTKKLLYLIGEQPPLQRLIVPQKNGPLSKGVN